MRMSRLEILAGHGFKKDPFRTEMETADQERICRTLAIAISSGSMVAVVGDRGIGKSITVNKALRADGLRIVRVQANDKARITVSDIEIALILDVSDETPKRSREVRARQLRRVLGESARKSRVVCVIEEAHRLHHTTLRALKQIREIEWMGERIGITFLLIGQSDPFDRAGLSEVRLRADTVRLMGLSRKEAELYIRKTAGDILPDSIVRRLCESAAAKNFLDLQQGIMEALEDRLIGAEETETETPQESQENKNNNLRGVLNNIRNFKTAKAV